MLLSTAHMILDPQIETEDTVPEDTSEAGVHLEAALREQSA